MKKKPLKLLMDIALFLMLCVLLVAPTLALDFNGSSSSSGGGGTVSNGYAVNTNGTALAGFRFSLVNSSNDQCGNSIDIISNNRYSAYINYKKFDTKQSKAWWVSYYTNVSEISTSINNTNFFNQTDLGFATPLPSISGSTDIDNLSANLQAWQGITENTNIILSLIGYNRVPDTSSIGSYKIIIEPLLAVGLEGGDNHLLTLTELAVYGGGYEYNGNFAAIPTTSSSSGSWGYIANYTNRHLPNYMRTETADCNWGAASWLDARASFADIITKGYGANVLSATSMGVPQTFVLDINGVLNGQKYGDLGEFGRVNVWLNGEKVADYVNDYYNPAIPLGTEYWIEYCSINEYICNGISSQYGTITQDTEIVVDFSSKKLTLDINGILNGVNYNDLQDFARVNVYINGSLVSVNKDWAASDFYSEEILAGSTYLIEYCAYDNSYACNGIYINGNFKSYTTAISGTITENTSFVIDCSSKLPVRYHYNVPNNDGTVDQTFIFGVKNQAFGIDAVDLGVYRDGMYLNQVDGVWYCYLGDSVYTNYTGLIYYNNSYFYVSKGVLDWNFTGLAWNGTYGGWYYVKNGIYTLGVYSVTCDNGITYSLNNSYIDSQTIINAGLLLPNQKYIWENSGQFGGWDRVGYKLLGWAEEPNAIKQSYDIYQSVEDWWVHKKRFDINQNTNYIEDGYVDLYAVWVKEYTIDVNGMINGVEFSNLQDFARVNVYINDVLVSTNKDWAANDFYSTDILSGSTYRIEYCAYDDSYICNGVYINGNFNSYTACITGIVTENMTFVIDCSSNLPVKYHYNVLGNDWIVEQSFVYGIAGNRFGYNIDGTPKWVQTGQFGEWDRKGYALLGWSENPNATTSTYEIYCNVEDWWINDMRFNETMNANYSEDGYVDLYAVWVPKSVTVIFNKNDGNGATAEQNFVYGVAGNRFGYNTDGAPKWVQTGQFGEWDREGYTLLGWSEDPSATIPAYDIYGNVEDWWILEKCGDKATVFVNLYAVWEINHYTFDVNGMLNSIKYSNLGEFGRINVYINGEKVSNYTNDYYNASVPYGSEYWIEYEAINGYICNDISSQYGIITQNTEVIIYFSSRILIVNFNKNDNTGKTAEQSFIYGATGNRFGYNTDGSPKWKQTGQFGSWDREGYILLGWSEDPNAITPVYEIYNVVEDSWILKKCNDNTTGYVELYAVWKPVTLPVRFHYDANDSVAPKIQYFTYEVPGNRFGYNIDNTLFDKVGFNDWGNDKHILLGWSETENPDKVEYELYSLVADQWIIHKLFTLNLNDNYLKDGYVDLYAVWTVLNDSDEKYIYEYYEGEKVIFAGERPENGSSFGNDVNTISGWEVLFLNNSINYPNKPLSNNPVSNSDLTDNYLYTYFMEIEPNGFVEFDVNYGGLNTFGKPSDDTCVVRILYNNPPVITAYDKWITLKNAKAGITNEALHRMAIAEDIEDGIITYKIEIVSINCEGKMLDVNSQIFKFTKTGDVEVTYKVTDKYGKTDVKTIVIHIINFFSNSSTRFISANYYPAMNIDFYNQLIDSSFTGTFTAKRIKGVLCYVDPVTNEPYLDSDGNVYPVDAGPRVKTMLKADGTYIVIPLSKWLIDVNCANSLKKCLSNTKDENGDWSFVEEIWIFTTEDIDIVRKNIIDNGIDSNFYLTHLINGRCIHINSQSKYINNNYINDIDELQLKYLNIVDGVLYGFKDNMENEWNNQFNGILVLPETVISISSNAFKDSLFIKSAIFPKTIINVDSTAFNGCNNLKTIYVKQGSSLVFEINENVSVKFIT